MFKKQIRVAIVTSLMTAAIVYAGAIKSWFGPETLKANDLNANFLHIHSLMVGGHGARLVDSDVNASAGIQWTKLASGGISTTGSWVAQTLSLLVTNTVYGGFQMQGTSSAGLKFGEVTCTTLTTAGTGTAGVLAIRNVTDATTLCSGSFTCTTAKDVAQAVFNCNTQPLGTKTYAIDLTTACGTTNPTGIICNVEIEH